VRLLLDTNVLIAVVERHRHALRPAMHNAVTNPEALVHASVASLWEIAIKARLRK
jgi:PIN domain nuclease of toxin-antitoxin system